MKSTNLQDKMDNLVTTPKKQVNIISNIVINSLEPMLQTSNITEHGSTTRNTTGATSGKATSLEEAEEPVLFKHLCFDFPMPKRKIEFESETEPKRSRRTSDDDADSDDDVKVFNYMTGTYETVRSKNRSFNTWAESQNEPISVEQDNYFIKQEIADLPLLTEESIENTNASENGIDSLKDSTSAVPNGHIFDNFVSNVLPNSNASKGLLMENKSSENSTNIEKENSKPTSEKNNSEQAPSVENSSDSEDLIIVSSSFPVPKKSVNIQSTLLKFVISSPNKNHSQTLNGGDTEESSLSEKTKLKDINIPLWDSKCQICSHVANTNSELISHIYNAHLKNMRFVCLQCDLKFENNNELKGHRGSHECKQAIQNNNKLHQEPNQKSITEILLSTQAFVAKCFDCDTIFDGKEELKSHAFHAHLSSTFRCNLHETKNSECGQCMYEALLRAIQQNNIDIPKGTSDSDFMEINETNTTNKLKDNNDGSHNNESDPAGKLLCSDKELKKSAVKNNENLTKNQNNTSQLQESIIILSDEDTVEYPLEQIVEDRKETTTLNGPAEKSFINILPQKEVINKQIINNNSKENKIVSKSSGKKFKCFDCRFSALDEHEFKCHIVKHVGSKFRCMYHFKAEEDCLKCRYEQKLTDTAVCVTYCKTCGFAAVDSSMLEKHIQEENGCMKWRGKNLRPQEITCCHCPYVTIKKKFLYYHAVDHVDESFSCLKHNTIKEKETCLECIYEECLRDAKNNIIDCKKCGFITTIIEVFDVHQCNNASAEKNQCWDCDKFCLSFEELRNHAIQHYKSSFVCTEHNSKVDCSKCIYQAAVESLEKNIFICAKCSFKSLSEAAYNRHDCKENMNKVKFQCPLCIYTTDNKNLLHYHCKYHYNKTFTCEDHPESIQIDCNKCAFSSALSAVKKTLFVCDKCDFTTFNGFRLKLHKNNNCDIVNNESDNKRFICFDCGKTYNVIYHFKQHAFQHIGSQFKCTDHDTTSFSCKKCIYEHIIKNLQSSTFTCRKCGFKSYTWYLFRLHERDDAACEIFKAKLIVEGKTVPLEPKIYNCFDCDFSHERLDFLEKHVTAHRSSNFKCDQHKDIEETCLKCIYTRLISNVPKVTMICHDCRKSPKFTEKLGLHYHILQEHQDSCFACRIHCSQKLTKSCGKCFYESAVKDVLKDNYINLNCWDCEGKLFAHKAALEKHMEEFHLESKFKCNDHLNKSKKSCSKCIYEKLLQSCCVAIATKKIKPIFQCFDCDFSNGILHNLKQHTRLKHNKNNFICKKHLSNTDFENCPECFYGKIASDHPKQIIRCYECNPHLAIKSIRALKTHIWSSHKLCSFVCVKHTSTSINCGMCWFQNFSEDVTRKSSNVFLCFECDFKSDRLGLFKEHILFSHSNSVFECKEMHRNQTNVGVDKCRMCLYSAIVSNCKRKPNN